MARKIEGNKARDSFQTKLLKKEEWTVIDWRNYFRYMPLQADIDSVAYWDQTEPYGAFPKVLDRGFLEIL